MIGDRPLRTAAFRAIGGRFGDLHYFRKDEGCIGRRDFYAPSIATAYAATCRAG